MEAEVLTTKASANRSERWIDRSTQIATTVDNTADKVTDSIFNIYQPRIALKEQQILAIQQNDANGVLNSSQRANVKQLDLSVSTFRFNFDI